MPLLFITIPKMLRPTCPLMCITTDQQEVESFPERAPYLFRLFHGDVVQLNPNGSFLVNGKVCAGPVYTGADEY